jgi:hypothetical protein
MVVVEEPNRRTMEVVKLKRAEPNNHSKAGAVPRPGSAGFQVEEQVLTLSTMNNMEILRKSSPVERKRKVHNGESQL